MVSPANPLILNVCISPLLNVTINNKCNLTHKYDCHDYIKPETTLVPSLNLFDHCLQRLRGRLFGIFKNGTDPSDNAFRYQLFNFVSPHIVSVNNLSVVGYGNLGSGEQGDFV